MKSFSSPQKISHFVEVFVEEELTCPICESYNVEELSVGYSCSKCGTTWKINKMVR